MSKLTRRDLLERSLFAATAAAVGGMHATAHAGPKASARKIGPNDQIRIAVIGVKGRGRDHISHYLKMDDVTVAALCDCDVNVIPSAAKMVTDAGKAAPKAVQDLRRIMEDPEIDAVSIATTNHWHALAAIWAMQNGKDVYVEKPVSHNVREGRVLVDTARKYGRICQAGTQIRSNPGAQEAIQFLRDGKLGKVQVARGLCYKRRKSIGQMQPGTVPQGVDYNLWIGPAAYTPYQENRFHYNWHWVWNTGNGDLGNQGIHQMDVARWGLGKMELPRSAVGLGGRFGYVDDGETPNTHVTVLDYGDSQLVFEVRGLETKDYRGAMVGNVFHCEDGYVAMTSYNSGAAFDKSGNMIATFKGSGNHYRNFIDAMRSRKVEDLNGEILEGHLSSAMCHLGNVSYRLGTEAPFREAPACFSGDDGVLETLEATQQHLLDNGVEIDTARYRLGRVLKLDPKKEAPIKDKEANALFFREYRDGFVVPKKA